ncbi:hypothetical protein C9374_009605 [Naegleria lovaniensis]|uniref:Uncharacterized protein n=1 Tax=Naegleria lovaniensis TaxID=51637 RepID=A0AA88H1Q7_NAELO|nr:uncharacterized protein C9374_009605 [Naegleria lovaniensis]KAG2393028.1 hypothetical protein C9374_009605 [Naegleria lovaniensis]
MVLAFQKALFIECTSSSLKNITLRTKWAAYALKTWFSTQLLRVLTAQNENPTTNEGREVVTMHGDGHDTEFDYAPVDENEIVPRKDLYSWKLKRTGLRTQVIQDIQGFALMVSDAAKCNPDQTMFKKMPIHTLMHPTDVLQLDGGYSYKWIIKKAPYTPPQPQKKSKSR